MVELSEKFDDSRVAHEVLIALPRELNLSEQINLVKDYVRDCFVRLGMCADIAIHDKRNGNPHAHILLTTRAVTYGGFTVKIREWDKHKSLLKWREQWADALNRVFERMGLDDRVSHESYKVQGIDKKPAIHLSKGVLALERRGIQTERGNINREIIREREEMERKRQRSREYDRGR